MNGVAAVRRGRGHSLRNGIRIMNHQGLQRFRALHRDDVLLIANAWDCASTILAIECGAKAIATTSSGLAWALGYPDGDIVPQAELLAATRAIVRVARDVPVSADIEGGYSDDPEAVANLAVALTQIGVIGINLEDGSGPPQRLVEKIHAVKRALRARNADIFINARTDMLLLNLRSGPAALEEICTRVRGYTEAGADGIFVPMLVHENDIAEVSAATALPLNVLATPGLAVISRLRELGVRRVSAGSAIARIAYAAGHTAASTFLSGDVSGMLGMPTISYGEMNARFTFYSPSIGG